MVTIDNKIYNVGEFKGDLTEGKQDYERAKQGADLVKKEMSALEERLKADTGYSQLEPPEEKTTKDVRRGDVTFNITSIKKIKKPQYKTAVEGMENYLDGIFSLISGGRTITGVVKEGKQTYVSVDRLLEEFDIIVAGVMLPDVKHTIKYDVTGALADEIPLDEIVLKDGRNPSSITEENFANYVRMDRIISNLTDYVKAYEAELSKGQRKKEKLTQVTDEAAYETTKSKATGVDWMYVVTKLITVPTNPKEKGELNILSDDEVSKAEKERQMPTYKLMYREPLGEKKLYVSLQSVYNRIQELKEERTIESKRLKVEPKEVV